MKHLLNPHLLSLGILGDDPGEPMTVAPQSLVTPRRFGTGIKHIYAEHHLAGGKSAYPARLYDEHIRIITGGACREDDGSKGCLEDYRRSFDALLDSMRGNGFDHQHPIPVDRHMTALDGAHRLAAALALNIPVPVLKFPIEGPAYTSAVFSGMDLDRAAVEHCKLSPTARLMVLFGDNPRWHVSPVYIKTFRLPSPIAQDNLITELYLGESWLGDSATGYRGAAPKARPCFARGDLVTVLVVDMPQAEVIDAKNTLRAAAGIRDVVHATDTQSETVRVARCILHDPSIAFLSRPHKHMPRLESLLGEYLGQIGGADQDFLCVDGSATLARYGLREPADLDFLHAITVACREPVSSHNAYSALYPMQKDDIIFDPANHFWSRGVKYASLDVVRRVKRVIDEPKSVADLKLMEGL